MAQTPLSAAELMEVIEAVRVHGSVEAAADALHIDAGSLRERWRLAKKRLSARAAQARYYRSAKGQAVAHKYDSSAKRKAARKRYRGTTPGKHVTAEHNARRIYIGNDFHGRARSVEQATLIRAYVRGQTRGFKQLQKAAAV